MTTRKYSHVVDGITFNGTFEQEDDEGYDPIFSLCTLEVQGIDLMLVIDPRVVHEIEEALRENCWWNS
jgi:hypothetical protein